ncbi:MAG: caspase family protein, partial [Pseudomonadota bacterium]
MNRKNFAFVARCSAAFAVTLGILVSSAASAQSIPRRVALLVGVGEYMDTNIPQLEGPPHDVEAMRDVLVRRWGFLPKDIKTLVNREATRANILSELSALSRRSSAGDEVLVFFSGHGTSSLDALSGLPLPHGSGAFVPSDFKRVEGASSSGLIVGRTDLVPIYTALEAGGRRIWAISDSCYSGQQVRSVQLVKTATLPQRMIPLLAGKDAREQGADMALIAQAPKPEPYPYRATAYLSASAEGERAKDIPKSMLTMVPTFDGKPHGAMTDALLRVLEGQIPGDLDGDGMLTLNEVHRATSEFMDKRAYGHTPQRLPSVEEDGQGIGNRPVLGVRGVAAPPRPDSLQPLRVSLGAVPASLA